MPYFVRTASGVEFGPVSSKELREAARAGTLARRDLVRAEGTVDWFRADRVKGLDFDASEDAGPIPIQNDAASARSFEPSIELDEPSTAASTTGYTAHPSPQHASTLGAHIEALALRGFHVRALSGETVETIISQSVVDAMRVSFLAAALGRRGVLVLTTRRVFVVQASVASSALESVYLDRIDRVGFGTRRARARLVAGLIAIVAGLGILGLPMLRVWWLSAAVTPLPVLEAALAFAIGGILVVLSRYRALEFGVASGSVPFGKAGLESDAISRIDELRERAIQRRN